MTGMPINPRVLAPGEPGNVKTCATCKHYAVTVTQFVKPGELKFICMKDPPVVQAFPVRTPDGTIVRVDRITSYPEPEPFQGCNEGYAPPILVATKMPRGKP